jgi:hypothetical protein
MSNKPETPGYDVNTPGESTTPDIPAGPRFSGSEEILRIEQELVAEGRDMPNRAIPLEYHPEKRDYDDAEQIRAEIEAEAEKEHPNRSLIGLLNRQL